MELTRREVLAASGATLAGLSIPAAGAPAGGSLDSIARRGGRGFGSAVGWSPPGADRGSFANPAYARVLEEECGILVPENELKWAWTRPAPGRFDFRQADAIADYAERHGFRLRGHTLFWTPAKWYPKWLAQTRFASAAEAEALLTNHVQTVCRRYGKRIYSYDVVNEAIQPETGEIRATNVTRAIGGERFLDVMFHTARAEAPHAQLVYNDYMSWERTADDERHMRGVLKLLEGFRKRGTPVDALGVQSHIRLLKRAPVAALVRESEGPGGVSSMKWWRWATGLRSPSSTSTTAWRRLRSVARDRMVADYARAYFDVMLSYRQLGDILAWGMVDRYSWLEGFDPRRDKLPKRGTPYDARFRSKPLRDAIAAALAGAVPNA